MIFSYSSLSIVSTSMSRAAIASRAFLFSFNMCSALSIASFITLDPSLSISALTRSEYSLSSTPLPKRTLPPSPSRATGPILRSEEHTSELQSQSNLLFPLFFFNDTAPTEIYTLSLHDALPIFGILSLLHSPSKENSTSFSLQSHGPYF